MKLRWTESQLKYLNKPIPVAERDYNWVGWFILSIVSLCGLGYLIYNVIGG